MNGVTIALIVIASIILIGLIVTFILLMVRTLTSSPPVPVASPQTPPPTTSTPAPILRNGPNGRPVSNLPPTTQAPNARLTTEQKATIEQFNQQASSMGLSIKT